VRSLTSHNPIGLQDLLGIALLYFICFVILAVTVGIVYSLMFKIRMILTILEEQMKLRGDSCKFLFMPILEDKNVANFF
jgi:hypothetical protein